MLTDPELPGNVPPEPDASKNGADDFILRHGADALVDSWNRAWTVEVAGDAAEIVETGAAQAKS